MALDPVRPVVYERVSGRGIFAYDYETGERRLVVDVAEEPGRRWVTVSPDGNRLAYFSYDEAGSAYRLLIVAVEGGAPREIHRVPVEARYFADAQPHWSPDGSRILYQTGPSPDDPEEYLTGPHVLLSVPVEGGEPTVVARFDGPPLNLALNLAAGRMAYEAGLEKFELWKTELTRRRGR